MDESTSKACSKCGEVKPLEEFKADVRCRGGRAGQCHACLNAYDYAWKRKQIVNDTPSAQARRTAKRRDYAAKREQVLAKKTAREKANREAVFDHYGRVCACPSCGSTENLTIDHVNGDGRQHRIATFGKPKTSGQQFYSWLVRNDFPDNPPLQVLCVPCNSSKRLSKSCRLGHDARPWEG